MTNGNAPNDNTFDPYAHFGVERPIAMSDETVDQVAKAIAEAGGSNWNDCLRAPGMRMAGMYRAMARAAILAMRAD